MGIIALDMDLDSAIHILNYCLSSSSSPFVQSIFKYHNQCLKKKMLKIQKTVAVVSPLSVSNSFTCLEVEHVEDVSRPVLPIGSGHKWRCEGDGIRKSVRIRDGYIYIYPALSLQ